MNYEAESLDRWAEGEASAILEVEYWQVVQALRRFSEREAKQRPAPNTPNALEIAAGLAVEELPNGPAPSLSDTLHALDRTFASWQAEDAPYQRLQARRLVYTLGELTMLRRVLLGAPDDESGGV
jgi:hypothetical protein